MADVIEYERPGKKSPDLDAIEADLVGSAMGEKGAAIRWDESDGKLKVIFASKVLSGDKVALDAIVAAR